MPLWIAIAGALLLAVAVAAAALWRWRRAKRARRPARVPAAPKYPVILAHGLMGFDVVRFRGREAEYFKGVPKRLRRMGAEVHVARVPPLANVARRADAFAEYIRSLDAKRVNVVAHSMGGLDARYAIANLGLGPKVASLITVGTPHRGTPVADVGANLVGDRLGLRRALALLGVDVGAFYDITTTQMSAFNEAVKDVHGVAYASYEARAAGGLRMNPLLLPGYLFLSETAGANDGLVPTASQRWGDVWGRIDADHWAQIGWSGRFDAPEFYSTVVRELRARGF